MVKNSEQNKLSRCKHCGLDSRGAEFCCIGCSTAWQLIQAGGLHNFYAQADRSYAAVKNTREREYEVYDHQDFLEKYTEFKSPGARQAYFKIEGLYCSACIWLIEKLPQLSSSCLEARVNFERSELQLLWRDQPQALSSILLTLSKLGYPCRILEESKNIQHASRAEWIRLGVTGALAIACMHLGLYFLGAWNTPMEPYLARGLGLLSAILALPVVTYGAWPFFRASIYASKLLRLHTDTLICTALIIGYIYSLIESLKGGIEVYYDSVSMVVFLLLCGRILTRRSVDYLNEPICLEAFVRFGNKVESVPAVSLKVNDVVVVPTGELIPKSSELLSAEAWVDQSVITGESYPVRFVQGQEVAQASTNQGPEIELRIKSMADLTELRPWQGSADLRPPEFWEQGFTAIVLLLGVLSFFLFGIEKAVALLIVACPCALALSRPLVLDSVKKQALKKGISIKNLLKLLSIHSAKSTVFDKTGTLTEGQSVIRHKSLQGFEGDFYLAIAYAMCVQSAHPVSRSIAFYLFSYRDPSVSLRVDEIPGKGLVAEYGKQKFFLKKNQSSTVLCVGDKVALEFDLQDKPRESSLRSLRRLKALGHSLELLSGDHIDSVKRVNVQLGGIFDRIWAEQSPQEKATHVDDTKIFVGDGMNDAAAMQNACFSIGFHGSAESNLKIADAYLFNKNLELIPELFEASFRAVSRIRINYLISIIYNLTTISLVLTGFIGPILCAIFMPLSSITVIIVGKRGSYFD